MLASCTAYSITPSSMHGRGWRVRKRTHYENVVVVIATVVALKLVLLTMKCKLKHFHFTKYVH